MRHECGCVNSTSLPSPKGWAMGRSLIAVAEATILASRACTLALAKSELNDSFSKHRTAIRDQYICCSSSKTINSFETVHYLQPCVRSYHDELIALASFASSTASPTLSRTTPSLLKEDVANIIQIGTVYLWLGMAHRLSSYRGDVQIQYTVRKHYGLANR